MKIELYEKKYINIKNGKVGIIVDTSYNEKLKKNLYIFEEDDTNECYEIFEEYLKEVEEEKKG